MAEWHLKEIERELDKIGWRVISRLEGDSYKFSEHWIIQRETILQINFNGQDDLKTLPLDKAYGCEIQDKGISLYFYKRGDTWDKALDEFLNRLDQLN